MAYQLIEMAKTNYSLSKADWTQTQDLWMKRFVNVPDETMGEAILLAFDKCKYLPTISELNECINEIKQQKRYEQPKALEQGQKQWNSKPIEFIVNAMKTGTIHDIAQKVDISKAVAYAKTLWPEISEDIVRMNFCEIEQCRQESEMCTACSWLPSDCLAGGYHNSMRLEPTGFVHLTMVPCRKRVS